MAKWAQEAEAVITGITKFVTGIVASISIFSPPVGVVAGIVGGVVNTLAGLVTGVINFVDNFISPQPVAVKPSPALFQKQGFDFSFDSSDANDADVIEIVGDAQEAPALF